MEFFGGEALISTKFFRGRPIFFHVLWKSSWVNRMQLRGRRKGTSLTSTRGVQILNPITHFT